jgi:hypothetical protein
LLAYFLCLNVFFLFKQRRNYKGVVDAGLRIGREEGFGAFWHGSQPFVMRAMLVGACQVATYDQFRYGDVCVICHLGLLMTSLGMGLGA